MFTNAALTNHAWPAKGVAYYKRILVEIIAVA